MRDEREIQVKITVTSERVTSFFVDDLCEKCKTLEIGQELCHECLDDSAMRPEQFEYVGLAGTRTK